MRENLILLYIGDEIIMETLLWLRIIIISKLIFIIYYFNYKTTLFSLLTIISPLILRQSNNWNLIVLELLYYLILTLYFNFKNQKNTKITEMKEKQSAIFAKARQIHQNSLPDKLPEEDDICMSAFYQPAEELGGDYYNVFKIDHGPMDVFFNQYFIYMFDVSGHGIDSAMLGMFINNTIEDYFKLQHNKGEKVAPKDILQYIEKQYQEEGYPDDYLICLFVGVLDLNNYEFNYSSLGFQFPFYKITKNGALKELETGGLPISASIETACLEFEETSISFQKDEMIFFTTDGLVEQTISSGKYNHKLKEELRTINYFNPYALVESIKNDFINFHGTKYGDDDITYLAIGRLTGEKKEWLIEEREEANETQQEITSYLKNVDTDTVAIRQIFQQLSDLIWKKAKKLEVKILITKDYLMVSLSGVDTKFNWSQLINNNLAPAELKNKDIELFRSHNHKHKVCLFKKLK